jgi:alpha-amylase
MDYETFGEHQWKDTGIFEFMKALPAEVMKHPDNDFATPSEIVKRYKTTGELDVHNPISWADMERDLSAWLGNRMQQASLRRIYDIEKAVVKSGNIQLLQDWRRMQTSDHFYYMCTKWFNDGDVHKYFNPYDTPYESFINFTNAINDIALRLKDINNKPDATIAETTNTGNQEQALKFQRGDENET